jgi:hypothetical protein
MKNAETYPRALCSPLLATFEAFARPSWSWMPVSFMHRSMNSRSNFATDSIVRRVPHIVVDTIQDSAELPGTPFCSTHDSPLSSKRWAAMHDSLLSSKRWAATLFIPSRIYQSTLFKIRCLALINTGCFLLAIGASDQETQGADQTNSKGIR